MEPAFALSQLSTHIDDGSAEEQHQRRHGHIDGYLLWILQGNANHHLGSYRQPHTHNVPFVEREQVSKAIQITPFAYKFDEYVNYKNAVEEPEWCEGDKPIPGCAWI